MPRQMHTSPLNATLGLRWVVVVPCSIEAVEINSTRLLKVSAQWENGAKTTLWTTFQLANLVDDKDHKWPTSSDLTLYYKGAPEKKEFAAMLVGDWFTPCFATPETALKH